MGLIFPGYFGGIRIYEADKCLKCTHTHTETMTQTNVARSKNIKTGLCSVFMFLETPASGWLCSLEKILCDKIVAGKTRWIMIHLDRKYRLTNPQGRLLWIWPISHFPWIFAAIPGSLDHTTNPWIIQGNPGWLVTLYTPVVFAMGEYCFIDSQDLVNVYKSTFTIQLIYHSVNCYYMWVNYY